MEWDLLRIIDWHQPLQDKVIEDIGSQAKSECAENNQSGEQDKQPSFIHAKFRPLSFGSCVRGMKASPGIFL
jgi:hypothetical protein